MSRILRWLAWLGFLAALIWAVVYLSGSPEAGLVTGLAMVIAMLAIGVVAAWWDDPEQERRLGLASSGCIALTARLGATPGRP